MRAEIAAAVAAYAGGGSMNVTETSRQLRISPKTFHKYVARFRQRGVPGFFPDSRRPLTSPTRLPVEWDEVLIRLRKQEAEAGWDYGADAVLMRLEEQPELWPTDWLPSRSSVNRIFERRGQLEKVPHRRPRRSSHRFQRERVNELWQFDGFKYDVADESEVVVLQLTDDCSRVDLALQAAASENGNDVWATFCAAVTRYGLPAALLSDNGAAFSGKRRGWTSMFEHQLEAVGVYALTSRVSHPQTCGKNERAHQRVQKWLKRRPPARDLADLQGLLDTYRDAYNDRGNKVLNKLTPHQRFDLGPLDGPDDLVEPITHVTRPVVSATGSIAVSSVLVGVGRRHAGKSALVFRNGDHATVFIDDLLARQVAIDWTRRYQPQER